jgi:crotonobetainyl-CoA:carnitine CoA-transferase CaiB-like acyl-CoA transferase
MQDSALYWVMLPAIRDLVEDGNIGSGELPTFGRHACYNVYMCRDGLPIALGALEPKFWIAFCRGAGRPDLAARHAEDADQTGLLAETRALFATRSREEWLGLFTGDEVCLTPVNSPAEAFADPHATSRGRLHAAAGLRTIRAPFLAAPVDLAPAPLLGQHNAEILGGDGSLPVPLSG